MPIRAQRRCTASGCGSPPGPSGRCDRHFQPRPRPKAKARPSATQQGYNARWATLSQRVRKEEPVCRVRACGKPSEHVDHIDGDRTNWERWNLQALCKPCHSRKTAKHDGGFGNKRTPR